MELTEKTLSEEYIYQGRIIKVRRDEVELPNGHKSVREVVEHSGGVCVLPLTDKEEVIFVRQFRYPYKEVILKFRPESATTAKKVRSNAASASLQRKPARKPQSTPISASCIRRPAIAARSFICSLPPALHSAIPIRMRMNF